MRFLFWLLVLLLSTKLAAPASSRPPKCRQPFLRFVSYVVYQQDSFPQKRTPPKKLPRQGRRTIPKLEALLTVSYQALIASDTTTILSPLASDSLQQAWYAVRKQCPKWNTLPYE